MQARSRRPNICLFCAYASQSWPGLRSSTRIPIASFSTSAPRGRTKTKRKNPRALGWFDNVPREGLRGAHRPGKHLGGYMPIKRAQEESINSRSSIAREELRKLVIERLGEVDIKRSTLIKTLKLDVDETEKQWLRFKLETQENLSSGSSEAYAAYHRGYAERALTGVDDQLIYNFYSFMAYKRFKNIDIDTQKAQADLRYPTEWYPATREVQRKIILHVGPTNSGKTYNALKRLEEAETGVYAGPLRLLAHEVYTRMNAKGKPCHLITGEERRPPTSDNEENGLLNACTVEMIPLNTRLDVAVIDEIQLMGSSDRGWAWTQAFLGVRAKEVHLCGEARTVPLIRELAAAMGDEVEVHNYERLSPLKVADKSLNGNLQELRKGDCVVCFTIVDIHALRRDIEKATGKKVAIVYGSLPPETRAEQARLFNDPDNDYDILVASDAIGMGLNLAIKRIIFETVWKYNGYEKVTLSTADLKQIAGRAGRYRTAHDANKAAESSRNSSGELAPNTETTAIPAPSTPPPAPADETVGIVTAFEKEDFEVVRRAMASEPEPLKSAGIYPPDSITERFARYFPPNTPFSYILLRLHEFSSVNKRFHLCGLKDQLQVAELMEGLTLTVADKIIFCASPANVKTNVGKLLVRELARRVSEQRTGAVTDIELLSLDLLDQPTKADRLSLYHLENLHKGLSLYLWLSYRFKGIFTTRALAFHAKELTEKKIGDALKAYSATRQIRRIALQQEKKEMLANKKKEALWAREGVEGEGVGRYEPDDVLVDEVDGEALTAQEGDVDDEGENPADPVVEAEESDGDEKDELEESEGDEKDELEESEGDEKVELEESDADNKDELEESDADNKDELEESDGDEQDELEESDNKDELEAHPQPSASTEDSGSEQNVENPPSDRLAYPASASESDSLPEQRSSSSGSS